jgi:hypothetical protein
MTLRATPADLNRALGELPHAPRLARNRNGSLTANNLLSINITVMNKPTPSRKESGYTLDGVRDQRDKA